MQDVIQLRINRYPMIYISKMRYNKQFKQIRNARHFRFESAVVITAQCSG